MTWNPLDSTLEYIQASSLQKDMSDVLGLVPARSGSKGIPRKNVCEIEGRPMLCYSVRAGREADAIDRTVVSTDDEEFRRIAQQCGADAPFLRPPDLATDEAATEPVIEHALAALAEVDSADYETVVLLQPTSPLRTATHVDEAIARYRESGADSLVSVYEDESYRWKRGADGARRMNYRDGRKRRQEKTPEFVESGAIYVVDADRFRETLDLQVGHTALYVMDRLASVDVDEPAELTLAACLINQRRANEY